MYVPAAVRTPELHTASLTQSPVFAYRIRYKTSMPTSFKHPPGLVSLLGAEHNLRNFDIIPLGTETSLMVPIPRLDPVMDMFRRSVEGVPLTHVRDWRPFSIDALGLITLLGAEEVNKSIGTLGRRRYTEYLPLLAANIVAGDRLICEQAGHAIYNITDRITTTELKGWFTRWLSSQSINNATTIFRFRAEDNVKRDAFEDWVAPLLSCMAVLPLLICTILIGDWFGVANTATITASIGIRSFLLWQRRLALDSAVSTCHSSGGLELNTKNSQSSVQEKSTQSDDSLASAKQLHRETSAPYPEEIVKLIATRADGKMVTIYAPRHILGIFFRDAQLPHPDVYHFTRYIGWLTFGVQMCILGMSSLFTQIYIVVLLVMSTWALCHTFDFDVGRECQSIIAEDGTTSEHIQTYFGTKLGITQENPLKGDDSGKDKRMWAYVRLQPTEKQEAMLKHWSMLPFDGVPWYESYNHAKAAYSASLARSKSVQIQPKHGSTTSIDPLIAGVTTRKTT